MTLRSIFSARTRALGIDLGTANTVVVAPDAGIVFDQPTVCCFQAYDAEPRFIAAGDEAHSFVGRVTRPLKIVRPLRNGVLSDMLAARELFQFVQRVVGPPKRFGRVRPHIGIPADATESERRALRSAATDAGFADPHLLAEPLLAAIGLGLEIDEARGRMIVDCGAGTTEVAVISLGKICLSRSQRGGGDALDQALTDQFATHHRFKIGPVAAENLKMRISQMLEGAAEADRIEVSGLHLASGLPQTLSVPVSDILPIWQKQIDQITWVVRQALGATPPGLSEDILEDGIVLTGGGALAAFLAVRIAAETGVATKVADEPRHCVARGLQRIVEQDQGRSLVA